jgi:transcriptional regulator with XRE-family HTH domain
MSTLPNGFGPALRALRQTLGLSQLALAHRLRSTQRHVSFLETGRSRATPGFLQRLCTELNLSTAQRSALFEASELRNPYPARGPDDAEIGRALDLIERRILRNWPFPAFALDRDWTVLRANAGACAMFAGFGIDLAQPRPSLLTLLLSPAFRGAIRNWEDASLGLYFRLQRVAEVVPEIRTVFDAARADGLFDHIPARLTAQGEAPVLLPVEIAAPGGPVLRLTPFVGQLVSLQDARLDAVEIEFMIPLDDGSEDWLRGLSR